MKHFKNLFSVSALVALFGFSSFSANARPLNSVYYSVYDYEDYLAENADDESEEFVFNKDYFDLLVLLLDCNTPYKSGDGIEISSVNIDEDGINFNIKIDGLFAYGLNSLDDEKTEALKEILAESAYEIFTALGEDDEGDTMIEKMEDMGINVNYNFFVEGKNAPVKSLILTPQFLNEVGQNENIAFYK